MLIKFCNFFIVIALLLYNKPQVFLLKVILTWLQIHAFLYKNTPVWESFERY